MARIFVATRLPASLAGEIAAIQEALDRRLVDVKWVEPENLHFTLRFFGEMSLEGVEIVIREVTAVAEATRAFTVCLEGIGTFPPRGRPRVVWIGMTACEPLVSMASALDRRFVAAGLGPADRAFAPHLTLGRMRDPQRPARGTKRRERFPAQATAAVQAAIGEARFGPAHLAVEEVTVVESRLSPRGPIYRNVHVARLGPPAKNVLTNHK